MLVNRHTQACCNCMLLLLLLQIHVRQYARNKPPATIGLERALILKLAVFRNMCARPLTKFQGPLLLWLSCQWCLWRDHYSRSFCCTWGVSDVYTEITLGVKLLLIDLSRERERKKGTNIISWLCTSPKLPLKVDLCILYPI